MSTGALAHLRVLDLCEDLGGPYCSQLMAGFGAEVVKIERPGTGDPLRSLGPFCGSKEGIERSIPFLWLNAGKKGVTLDIRCAEGAEMFKSLVRDADVLVENFSPRVMPELGLAYETLRRINPRLVMTSISNFGQTGPYREYKAEELQSYATSGLMNETGDPEKAPLAAGPTVAKRSAAVAAYAGTLVALARRRATDEGQHVDVSAQEAALVNIETSLTECLHAGKVKRRQNDRHVMVPWQTYECADGEAAIIGGPVRHWLRGAELFDEPALLDSRFETIMGRIENRDEFEALLERSIRNRGKKELVEAGRERKLAFGSLASMSEVLESPQHESRGFFVEVEHPETGPQRHCGAPYRMSDSPWTTGRAPLLGEHNEAVYRDWLGLSPSHLRELVTRGVL